MIQVLDKAFDVLVQRYGVIKRIYCEVFMSLQFQELNIHLCPLSLSYYAATPYGEVPGRSERETESALSRTRVGRAQWIHCQTGV